MSCHFPFSKLFVHVSVCLYLSRGCQPSYSPVPGGEPEWGDESWLDASDYHQPFGLLWTGWQKKTLYLSTLSFFFFAHCTNVSFVCVCVFWKYYPHTCDHRWKMRWEVSLCFLLTYLHTSLFGAPAEISISLCNNWKRGRWIKIPTRSIPPYSHVLNLLCHTNAESAASWVSS